MAPSLRLYEPRGHQTPALPAAQHPLHSLLFDRTPLYVLPQQKATHIVPHLQQEISAGQCPAPPHECEPLCLNRNEDHPPTSPLDRSDSRWTRQPRHRPCNRNDTAFNLSAHQPCRHDRNYIQKSFDVPLSPKKSMIKEQTQNNTLTKLSAKASKTTAPRPKSPWTGQGTTGSPSNVSEPAPPKPFFPSSNLLFHLPPNT